MAPYFFIYILIYIFIYISFFFFVLYKKKRFFPIHCVYPCRVCEQTNEDRKKKEQAKKDDDDEEEERTYGINRKKERERDCV